MARNRCRHARVFRIKEILTNKDKYNIGIFSEVTLTQSKCAIAMNISKRISSNLATT